MSDEKMREEFDPMAHDELHDTGPWTVSADGRAIESDDFTHDVILRVCGDFYSDEQRAAYSTNLAEKLNASAAHSAARIAELEGQVAMLRCRVVVYCDHDEDCSLYTSANKCDCGLIDELNATAQTAEQYKRRVQAEVLEEAAVRHETWHGFDKHGTSEFLRYMASELRNPAGQAEEKGEK